MRERDNNGDDTAGITGLLQKASDLSRQAVELARQGKVGEALSLENEADTLRNKARRAAGSDSAPSHGSVDNNADLRAERGPSSRATTVNALGEIGVPTSPRSIAEYAWARFGTRIDHRALPSLRRDEMKAWASPNSLRAVYVVPALEGNRFLPVRAKLALSEWPLERRLIGPWSERADHLTATIHIAKQTLWLSRVEPSAAQRLQTLLSAYAANVSGAGREMAPPDPSKVERAARAELDVIGPSDTKWRVEAAGRAREFLDEQQLIWGASLPTVVVRSA
jgi:hypothetical protein